MGGADAIVISSHATAASTCFADASSTGQNTEINSVIAAKASTITTMGTNFTNSQSQFIYNSIKALFPTITQGDVDDALGALSITEQGKQNLIDQGIVPFQQNLISLLQAVENDLDGGVILASTGIERRSPQFREVECVLFDVGIALLGVSALLTDGVSAAVLYGVDITWSQIFGASAVIGGIFSKYAHC